MEPASCNKSVLLEFKNKRAFGAALGIPSPSSLASPGWCMIFCAPNKPDYQFIAIQKLLRIMWGMCSIAFCVPANDIPCTAYWSTVACFAYKS